MGHMLSVHLEAGQVGLRNVPLPVRPDGFALIRLLLGGICNTDIELRRGYYGFSGTPGHEFVGIVEEADTPALVGKRVTGEINLACGNCKWCARGLGRHCPTRTVLGIVRHPGAFAEFLTLPEVNLHLVPDSISTEAAVFIEPLAAACEILDQVAIPPGARVAVLGDGKLGLLVSQVLQASGMAVHQFGKHLEKLRIAAAKGVTTELLPEELPEAEYEWVVDATGSAAGLQSAVRMTQPRGTVFLKSTVHGSVAVDTAPIIVDEITLVGSRCGRFEPAMALLEARRVDVESLIAARYSLDQPVGAFHEAERSGMLKVLLAAG
jgi:alcohol dehydrogenase